MRESPVAVTDMPGDGPQLPTDDQPQRADLEHALDRGRRSTYVLRAGVAVGSTIVIAAIVARVDGLQSWMDYLTLVGIYVVAAQGSNVVVGMAGQLALAPNAFMMVGGYLAAIAALRWHADGWLALVAGTVAAAIAAAALGAASLRLRGFFFGMITLTFASFTVAVGSGWTAVTGGSTGLTSLPPFGGTILGADYRFWLPLSWGAAAFGTAGVALLARSRFGDSLRALHRDEELASAFGINVFLAKLAAFVLSGLLAGLAGALLALYQSLVTPDEFGPTLAISVLMMIFLGGAGTVIGPVLGAAAITRLQLSLAPTGDWEELIFAIALVLILVLLPGGLTSIGSRVAAVGRRMPPWLARGSAPPGPGRRR